MPSRRTTPVDSPCQACKRTTLHRLHLDAHVEDFGLRARPGVVHPVPTKEGKLDELDRPEAEARDAAALEDLDAGEDLGEHVVGGDGPTESITFNHGKLEY